MFKKILLGLVVLVVVLAGVVLIRTLMFTPQGVSGAEQYSADIDIDRIAANMSRAITFKTISHQKPAKLDPVPFNGFLDWLVETYPNVSRVMERKLIATYTPLYVWRGSEPSLKPVLLTAHYDVVPVEPGTEGDWTQPPFSGAIVDDHVWGRGGIDDKGAVIAMMEAAEYLIQQGVTPKRTVYFSFGHDEELGGDDGAAAVAAHLQSEGVQLAWTLDEGSGVLKDVLPGIENLVASVNVAEKGYLTLDLTARAKGGHSSMPPNETAVGILAAAIDKLQKNPFPGGLEGITGDFFDSVGRSFPFTMRMLFANTWLFGDVIENVLSGANTTNAMLRTTIAPTMLSGSAKENVLPIEAVGTINFRIHPRDSIESVIAYVKETIADDRIDVTPREEGDEPSAVSSHEADGFKAVSASLSAVYENMVVVPGLTIAATDSKHYGLAADDSYRINPMILTNPVIASIHGTNERISFENLRAATLFYAHLLQNGM